MSQSTIKRLYDTLQKLLTLHRQLLEIVRKEHEALVQADLTQIQDWTLSKQKTLEGISATETERLKITAELAVEWSRPISELSLNAIAERVQATDLKLADQFRTLNKAILLLIQRITEQNRHNGTLVENFLGHIGQMKRNILGETVPKAETYTQRGQRSGGVQGARLFSKEA